MSTEHWHLLRTGLGNPSWNMALDEALLEHASSLAAPILRLYGWSTPAATFGYSQKYAEVASWTTLRPLIRRPTGGGFVPHDCDWTYSLIFPPEHSWYQLRAQESYRRVHEWISAAFGELEIDAQLSVSCEKPAPGRCFVGAEKFDVLAGGKKVAGAAQKRNRFGLLVQGSVQPPNSVSNRESWENALVSFARENFISHWLELKLSDLVRNRAMELDSEKYSMSAYNRRR